MPRETFRLKTWTGKPPGWINGLEKAVHLTGAFFSWYFVSICQIMLHYISICFHATESMASEFILEQLFTLAGVGRNPPWRPKPPSLWSFVFFCLTKWGQARKLVFLSCLLHENGQGIREVHGKNIISVEAVHVRNDGLFKKVAVGICAVSSSQGKKNRRSFREH